MYQLQKVDTKNIIGTRNRSSSIPARCFSATASWTSVTAPLTRWCRRRVPANRTSLKARWPQPHPRKLKSNWLTWQEPVRKSCWKIYLHTFQLPYGHATPKDCWCFSLHQQELQVLLLELRFTFQKWVSLRLELSFWNNNEPYQIIPQ